MLNKELGDFLEFIRSKGVVGLALGIIIGGTVTKVVTSLVEDIINPLLGLLLGVVGNLSEQFLVIGKSKIGWGHFVNTLIDFVIILFVVYYAVKVVSVLSSEKSSSRDPKKK